ncbi:hypothetical protein B5F78_16485 [Bacteroides sp. An279]|nr:hypothetical protein B5F78_16485 [Bacteroides sp. An279]
MLKLRKLWYRLHSSKSCLTNLSNEIKTASHYWRKKCSVGKNSVKQELAPICFKQAATESSLEEQIPHGVALLFPNGLRAHFGNGSEEILMELLTKSLGGGHV